MEFVLSILKNPLFSIFTGIVGFACGHYGSIIRHNSSKRKEIIERVLSVIENLRRKAETNWRSVDQDFYIKSITEITEAFSGFGPYASKRQRTKIKSLIEEYKSKDSSYFERGRQVVLNALKKEISGEKYISEYLDKFEKLALKLK